MDYEVFRTVISYNRSNACDIVTGPPEVGHAHFLS